MTQGGSLLVSCAVHAVLLFGTTGLVLRPVRYAVDSGSGGMEVSLMAAPPAADAVDAVVAARPSPEAAAPHDVTAESVIADAESLPAPVVVPAASLSAGDGSSPIPGADPTTLYLPGGAATAGGTRFRNPAPPYPYAAIQQRQEGLVMLEAVIDQAGRPVSIEVVEGSGFPLLDQSALHTVRRWKFDAAHIGFLPVQSRIVIPVRFVLTERSP